MSRSPTPATGDLEAGGFSVEHVTVTAEGVCGECVEYDRGLQGGCEARPGARGADEYVGGAEAREALRRAERS